MNTKYILKLLKKTPAKVTMLPPSMYERAVKEYPKCISYIPSEYITKKMCWDAIKSGIELNSIPRLKDDVAEFVIRRKPEYVCCCDVKDKRLRKIAIEMKPSIIQNLICTDNELAFALSLDPSLFGYISFSQKVQRMAKSINPNIACYLPNYSNNRDSKIVEILKLSNSKEEKQ